MVLILVKEKRFELTMTEKNWTLLVMMVQVGLFIFAGGLLYGIIVTVWYSSDLKRYDGPVDCFVTNLTINHDLCIRENNLQKCYDIYWKVNVTDESLKYVGSIHSDEIDDEDQVESLVSEHRINTTSECWYKKTIPKFLRWTKYAPDPVHVIVSWTITGAGLLLILIPLGILLCMVENSDQ